MAYNITLSGGEVVTFTDGVVDTTQFSIPIVGRNVQGYGEHIAKAFLVMLQHFSSQSAPVSPTQGQIWWDTSDTKSLKVYDGTTWRIILSSNNGVVNIDDSLTIEGDIIIGGDIIPKVDCTGGVGSDIGTPTLEFCNAYIENIFGSVTSARYSDLAERYEADKVYSPGTLVSIGGEKEITQTTSKNEDFFSVISTKPGFRLNAPAGPDETHPYVVLTGKAPVRVIGPIDKGDRLISSELPGVAEARRGNYKHTFGRSLESDSREEERLIMCAVSARE